MDGENNGKPYEQMDDLGGYPTIFGNIHMWMSKFLRFLFTKKAEPFRFDGLLNISKGNTQTTVGGVSDAKKHTSNPRHFRIFKTKGILHGIP